MLENGWARPVLYASMTKPQIQTVLGLAMKAKNKKLGIWKKASSDLTQFDGKLRFVEGGDVNGVTGAGTPRDAGPVIVPKLFLRLSTYSVEKKAKVVDGNFATFLGARPDARPRNFCSKARRRRVERPPVSEPQHENEPTGGLTM